jgi:predicted transcriptional regulator
MKTTAIGFRISPDELRKLDELCTKHNSKRGTWCRDQALNGQVVQRNPIAEEQWLKLAALASNFNQSIKAVNFGRLAPEFGEQLRCLEEILREIRRRLHDTKAHL